MKGHGKTPPGNSPSGRHIVFLGGIATEPQNIGACLRVPPVDLKNELRNE
jgi:hypothetical protein